MANDKDWERRSTEWVNMSHKSKQRKEAEGKSEEQAETNSTRPRHKAAQPGKRTPHGHARPPRDNQKK